MKKGLFLLAAVLLISAALVISGSAEMSETDYDGPGTKVEIYEPVSPYLIKDTVRGFAATLRAVEECKVTVCGFTDETRTKTLPGFEKGGVIMKLKAVGWEKDYFEASYAGDPNTISLMLEPYHDGSNGPYAMFIERLWNGFTFIPTYPGYYVANVWGYCTDEYSMEHGGPEGSVSVGVWVGDAVLLDAEAFPDEIFRQFVSQFDENEDGKLTEEERNAVTEMDAEFGYGSPVAEEDHVKLSSMKGIELFPNLEVLVWYFHGHQMTELDLRANRKLREVNVQKGSLTSLHVEGLTELEILECDMNDLTGLDLSSCTGLKELDITGNSISSMDFGIFPALEVLHCDGNPLGALDVTGNPALISLTCEQTGLKTLDISLNPALEYLVCCNNSLTELDVSGNPELTGLVCYGNGLTRLDVYANPLLEELYCNRNRLTELDVSANENLETLYCDNNALTELYVSNNPKLTDLSCSANQLTSLDVYGYDQLTDVQCHSQYYTVSSKNGCFFLYDLPGYFNPERVTESSIPLEERLFGITEEPLEIDYTYDLGMGFEGYFHLTIEPSECVVLVEPDQTAGKVGDSISWSVTYPENLIWQTAYVTCDENYLFNWDGTPSAGQASVSVEAPYAGEYVLWVLFTENGDYAEYPAAESVSVSGNVYSPTVSMISLIPGDTIELGQSVRLTVRAEGGYEPFTAKASFTGWDQNGELLPGFSEDDMKPLNVTMLQNREFSCVLTPDAEGDYYLSIECTDARNVSAADGITVVVLPGELVRLPGDADGSGQTDVLDVLRILQYCRNETDDIDPMNADVTVDGQVDMEDAMLILQFCCGWDVVLR